MAIIDWTKTHLIPTSGLEFWHLYDPATSTNGNINDASGNGRHIVQATSPPTLTEEVMNARPGWRFDGTNNPLASASSATIASKHVFVLAAAEETSFSVNRGLLSGKTAGTWLATDTGNDNFFPFAVDYDYRKSDTLYGFNLWDAPVGNIPELIEISHTTGTVSMDGVQVGQQINLTARKWKGYFIEQMGWNRLLTTNERRRVMLYYNIKYGTWARGVPLYFPTADLLTDTNIVVPSRFDDLEPDWDKITDKWEYEDGNSDRNEVASTAPRGWEYGAICYGDAGQAYAYREIFDQFNNQARRANPFYFRDKWGQVWQDVFIKNYKSSHDAHKSWVHNISFELETNTGEVVSLADPGGSYIIDGGLG